MMHTQLHKNFRLRLACLWIVFLATSSAFAQTSGAGCGSLANAYRPYDYRTDHDKLPLVTGAHFTEIVESLVRGTTNTRPGADIDYTLRAIPNHHRALIAMMRLGEKEKHRNPAAPATRLNAGLTEPFASARTTASCA